MANIPESEPDPQLAALLRHAGRRSEPPAAMRARVHARVLAEFEHRQTRRPAWRHWGVAAALVLGLASLWFLQRGTTATTIATVVAVSGDASVTRASAKRALAAGAAVNAGDAIAIANRSGLELRLSDGSALRLAANTEIVWTARERLALARGALYHDTDVSQRAKDLQIATALGNVDHFGTRYLVRVEPFLLTVLTRSGQVRVAANGNQKVVAAGEKLTADATGRLQLDAADPASGDWDWVDSLDGGFAIEGRSVDLVLGDIALRAGLTLVYASDAAAQHARRTILHGDPIELPPAQAAHAVLASTSLALRFERRRLVVSQQG